MLTNMYLLKNVGLSWENEVKGVQEYISSYDMSLFMKHRGTFSNISEAAEVGQFFSLICRVGTHAVYLSFSESHS